MKQDSFELKPEDFGKPLKFEVKCPGCGGELILTALMDKLVCYDCNPQISTGSGSIDENMVAHYRVFLNDQFEPCKKNGKYLFDVDVLVPMSKIPVTLDSVYPEIEKLYNKIRHPGVKFSKEELDFLFSVFIAVGLQEGTYKRASDMLIMETDRDNLCYLINRLGAFLAPETGDKKTRVRLFALWNKLCLRVGKTCTICQMVCEPKRTRCPRCNGEEFKENKQSY